MSEQFAITVFQDGRPIKRIPPQEFHSPFSRSADGEGPGAPDKACRPCPSAHVFSQAGAPAPDSENIILKHARAC